MHFKPHVTPSLKCRKRIQLNAHKGEHPSTSVKNFDLIAELMQEGVDVLDLLGYLEEQSKFLTDISADIIKAASVASSSAVMACRHACFQDWKADFAEKSSQMKLPLRQLTG
ncbi:hypothetical protein NDU88_003330 [Pleurodeles waltl]|uniref:Uncharacterized protein n=1 Tax=Pleurodeles waltl TaxID=8319 RepID=A0AAV7UY54_PLEWA|nr:hypothetical protein NDU88_003330 [Pleurodeles waltl]